MDLFAGHLEKIHARLRMGKLKVRFPRAVGLFRRRPGAHFHGTPELFLQTGGATDFDCPGGHFRLGTGEVCVMPSGVPHAETPIDLRTPYSILVFMQSREGFSMRRGIASPTREIIGSTIERVMSRRGQGAFRYLDEMVAAAASPERYRASLGDSLLESFLLTLLSEMRSSAAPPVALSPLVGEAEKRALANIGDPELSVAQLAASLGCSADYLSRCFQRERGTAFVGWIAQERVALARELLRDMRFNIAEVGWACGFAGPSYFIRVFRKYTGVTPRSYRVASLDKLDAETA